MAFAEILHTFTSWLNSYDPNLKDAFPLGEKLAALAESAAAPNTPQGTVLN